MLTAKVFILPKTTAPLFYKKKGAVTDIFLLRVPYIMMISRPNHRSGLFLQQVYSLGWALQNP
jgi:hypothetical protein